MSRFISKSKFLIETTEIIISIIKTETKSVYNENSCIIVNREWLRFLYYLLKFADNSIFWLKTDCNKTYIDSSNNTDIILRLKSEKEILGNKNFHPDLTNSDQVILLPFHKVKQFNKTGIIMFSSHYYLVPKILNIGKSFTIFFRFYFPIIETCFEHCLLQDANGNTILGISKDNVNVIAYSKDHILIDSGILLNQSYNSRWLSVGISYKEQDNQTNLSFYFENEMKRSYEKGENFKLSNNIAFIGNSKDFNNPFGAFSDLRIYRNFVDINGYLKIKNLTEEDKNGNSIGNKQYSIIFQIIHENLMKHTLNNFLKNWGNPLKSNNYDNS